VVLLRGALCALGGEVVVLLRGALCALGGEIVVLLRGALCALGGEIVVLLRGALLVLIAGIGLVVLTAGWLLWNLSLDVLWQPTDRRTARRMLFLAGLRNGETVVDLGCGDGRFVVLAAREFGARSVGVEIDPFRVLLGRLWILARGLGARARIIRGDMYRADVSQADVVVLFLSPTANLKLQERLKKEMKRGSRVVSYYHPIWGWTPDEVGEGAHGDPLYLYRIGGDADGSLPWRVGPSTGL